MKTTVCRLSLASLLSLSSLLLPISTYALPHVRETLNLTNGWNAVYIESTPDNPVCEDFFRDTSVIAAAAYMSDADAGTAQYDTSGNEIVKPPIIFLQWNRGEKVSSLQAIGGGGAYLLFATNTENIVFYGVPAAPKMTWRKVAASETNELFNLVGVSASSSSVSIKDYFGEGPFGLSKTERAIYALGGSDLNTPTLKNAEQAAFGRTTPIYSGKAYALTSTTSGEWPGVIGVQGSSVAFGPGANYASIRVQNCGTTNHTFRFTMVGSDDREATGEVLPPISRSLPRVDAFSEQQYTNVAESAAWTVTLAPDEETDQVFSLDRSKLETGTEYGAILVIEDMGASKMRVRVPITVVASESSETVKFPVGLWSGFIQMETVSRLDDPLPVKAGGTLKMNVMMHVAANGTVKLLQRVAAGVDTNGTPRLFRELESVPPSVENARRYSTVMMSIDTPVVEGAGEFGKGLVFDWTVGERAADNPFRHAWHPDHDGKTADYKGETPSGDDLGNYAGIVKPELWSIGNRMEFSWHKNNDPNADVDFEWTPAEKTYGFVTWTVSGLTAKEPIKSVGVFVLQRAIKAAEVE